MMSNRLRDILPGTPLVESPFFEEIIAGEGFDEETIRVARELNEKGFAVLRFPDDDFENRCERVKRDLTPRMDFEGWRSTGWKNNTGIRVQDAWKFQADVKAIAC